jgi:eukaryotic-like serine/threonine-protein kinase
MSSTWNHRSSPGEPDDFLNQLEPAQRATLVLLRARDDSPRVDPAFARRLLSELSPLVLGGGRTSPEPIVAAEPLSLPEPTEGTPRPRHIIRLWPFIELAAAALLIFAFAGLFFGSDQMLSWLPWREEQSIPHVESGNVQFDRGNVARTGEMPGPGPVNKPSPRWTFVDENYGVFSPAMVVDGVVYVRNGDRLLALDANSGAKRWEFSVEAIEPRVVPGLAVAEGLVFAGSVNGDFFAIDAATGVQRWVFATGQTFPTSPATSPLVVDGTVYFSTGQGGSADDTLYALDIDTGRQIWSFPIHGASYTSPAYDKGVLYVAGGFGESPQASVYAVDASTGVERWKFETDAVMFATPTVAEGTVFVEDISGVLYALDPADGREKWRAVLEEPSPLTYADLTFDGDGPAFSVTSVSSETVFVATYQGTLVAVDADSGQVRWRYETAYGQQSGPVVSGNVVYLGTPEGFVAALNASDGHELWRYEANGAVPSFPTVTDGVIYFGDAGTFYALSDTPNRESTTDSSVPMFRGNLARTGEMPGPAPANQPSLLWNYQSPDSLMVSAPVIVDGIVYASDGSANHVGVDALQEPLQPGGGSFTHRTFAIDANTGSRLWEIPFSSSYPSIPAVAGGLVFVNVGDGNLYAFDAVNGAERWRFPTGFVWVSTPAVDDAVVYVAGGKGGNSEATEGSLFAIDAESGAKRWEYKFEGSVGSSPTIANGLIYVGSAAGSLGETVGGAQVTGGVHAVDARNGQRRWFVATSSGIAATPAIGDGVVVVGDLADNLYALAVESGEVRWTKQLDDTPDDSPTGERAMISVSAAIANGRVYIGTFDGVVHALDATTGDELWTAETSYGQSSPATVVGDTIFLGTTGGDVLALDASNGTTRWRATTPSSGSSSISSPTITNGVIYLGAANGVYALGDTETPATPTAIEE